MSQYFDFHLHPAFKQFICKFEESYPSSRDINTLLRPIDLKNPIADILDEEFLHILESQSCLDQMEAGQLTLAIANIVPIERIFTNRDGLFGRLLNDAGFTRPLDQTYMNRVRMGQISYYQLFLRELNLYKRLDRDGKVQVLTRKKPVDLAQAGQGAYLAIGMEGGHGLCRTLIGQPGKKDTLTVGRPEDDDALSADFRDNPLLDAPHSLENLQKAMWAEDMDLFAMSLTHLSYIPEQALATHAYGIKMLNDEAAFPIGNGLTSLGKRVIDKAYTLKVDAADAPVLIDIKHMSLKSRLDLYDYRKENGYNLPLIASHMGVTGYSIDEWKGALNEASVVRLKAGNIPVVKVLIPRRLAGEWGAFNNNFTFNAWSINLMDEDIEEVLNSNGLIGISLDVRILGWQNLLGKGDKEEYLSAEEFRFFFPERARALRLEGPESTESLLKPTQEERHPLALCFNMLHVVSVGKMRTTKDPWQHITIGSDFDGLINPLINCRNAGKMSSLDVILLRWLPVAEERYRLENGGDVLLPRTRTGNVDTNKLKDLIRDVLYENGKRFISKWLNQKP